jgi:hypothetical protein
MSNEDGSRSFSINITGEADGRMKQLKAELNITQNRLISLALLHIDPKKLIPIIQQEDEEYERLRRLERAKEALSDMSLDEILALHKDLKAASDKRKQRRKPRG